MRLIGHVDYVSRSQVLGWAMCPDHPEDIIEIVIRVNGSEYGRCLANRYRAGLAAALGGTARDECEFRFEFETPLSVFLEQEIEILELNEGIILPNGRRLIVRPSLDERSHLTPILITSSGRSGSTMLMSELARLDEIVVADRYPYEIKQISYYTSAFRALVVDADRERSTNPDTMHDDIKSRITGSNPYHDPGLFDLVIPKTKLQDFWENTVPSRYIKLFKSIILDFYAIVELSEKKISSKFFCEKGDISEAARLGARLMFDQVKEIILVRDPRDLLSSALAFWARPAEEAIKGLREAIFQLEQIIENAGEDLIVVRYEDLILDPLPTRRRIGDFLGFQWPEGLTTGRTSVADGHLTSSSPEASIGRWKHDLAEDQIRACTVAFPAFMKKFGYLVRNIETPRSEVVDGEFRSPYLLAAEGSRAVSSLIAKIFDPNSADTPVDIIIDVTVRKESSIVNFLGDGWSSIEDSFVWTNQRESIIQFPVFSQFGFYQLNLVGSPFTFEDVLASQRVDISVNGINEGVATLRDTCVLIVKFVIDASNIERPTTITLRLPDASRPQDVSGRPDSRLLGFSLERLILLHRSNDALNSAGTSKVPPSIQGGQTLISLQDKCSASTQPLPESGTMNSNPITSAERAALMLRFESLGENCEFGLVQRRCGVEPLGLLRFASAPLPKLLAGLRAQFVGMGAPDNVVVELSSNGHEYMIHDRMFGFNYHAWAELGEMLPSDIHAREIRRVPFLIRKMIEDLLSGEKLFVYHGMDSLSLTDAQELSKAVRAYGPGVVLWVELADSENAAGHVKWIGPGLMKAFIDRFAPGENAHDFAVDSWVTLCQRAIELNNQV